MEVVHWVVWNRRREVIDDLDNLPQQGAQGDTIGGIATRGCCAEHYQMGGRGCGEVGTLED